MRALSACLTAVLGLGLAAMAACSSTASDDSAAAGSAGTSTGGTSSGGTSSGGSSSAGAGDIGAGGDLGAAGAGFGCPALDNGCEACVLTKCTDEETACAADTAGTDNCSDASGTFLFCVCSTDMTPLECTDAFSATNDTAKAVADCSKANCKAVCNL